MHIKIIVRNSICFLIFILFLTPIALGQKWEDVIVQQSEMIQLFLDDIDESFGFLSEAEQADYLNRYQYNLYMFQSFCYPFAERFPELGGQSMDLALATKGMILNSGIEMRQLISQSGDTLAMNKYNQWIKNKEKLAKEYSLLPSKRITGLESLEKKTNALEKDLHRITSAMNSNSKLIRVKWQDIQNHLKENEVAIEFTHFTFYDGKDWTDSTIYIALLITKNAEYPKLIRLAEEKEIKQLLNIPDALSSMQYVTNLYAWPDPDFEEQTNGEKLFELLWRPIEPYLQTGNVIYFSPTGYLHLISFSAIANSENTYISDKYALVQTSSIAVITDSVYSEKDITTIVAFGGIRYDASEAELTSVITQLPITHEASTKQNLATDVQRGDNWNYLPATLTEVDSIYNKAQRKNISVVAYTNYEAVEERYKSLSGKNSPTIIHIATHGFFFPDPAVANSPASSASNIVFSSSDNPLNRSGLLFAGANNTWLNNNENDFREDGILTAYEAANITLPNTDLVVLSACETGLGDIKGSEGVYGLQRSFKTAGANNLLMSLWKVPDAQTALFMQTFYQYVFEGWNYNTSFQKTQHDIKKRFPNPYYWAGFILVE